MTVLVIALAFGPVWLGHADQAAGRSMLAFDVAPSARASSGSPDALTSCERGGDDAAELHDPGDAARPDASEEDDDECDDTRGTPSPIVPLVLPVIPPVLPVILPVVPAPVAVVTLPAPIPPVTPQPVLPPVVPSPSTVFPGTVAIAPGHSPTPAPGTAPVTYTPLPGTIIVTRPGASGTGAVAPTNVFVGYVPGTNIPMFR